MTLVPLDLRRKDLLGPVTRVKKTQMGSALESNRVGADWSRTEGKHENNCCTEMCSGSEAGSYSRLIDFVHHSTQGLRVTKKKKMMMRGSTLESKTVMAM